MMIRRKNIAGVLIAGLVAAFGAIAVYSPPAAALQEEEEQPRRRSETLDPAVARVLQDIFTMIQEERFQEALAGLNKLMSDRGDRMKPFDRATTLELRATVKVNLEDFRGALRDFEEALRLNALPPERNNQLRYFIAQLYFQLEDYQAAIRGLQEWIRISQTAGQTVDPNAYYLLAAAYIQVQPPNYRAALDPAERAVAALTEPRKSYFDLLNLIYSELNENTKRAQLLERMITHWPGERSYWTQLSGLYSTTGRDQDAFSVLEVAYRAGLLKNEAEILTLVQYYSFFDNPYRGAKLLEREMETGTVARNVKNLTLLSQLWSQAREHKRAIPVLQQAARMSDSGELSYRLGQVLLADEQYAASERALVAALNKGGMTQTQTGDAWLLLGTARFSQAGPGDRATRARAREAFSRALNYSNTRGQARQWIEYIDAINATEEAQDRLEAAQREEQRRAEIERVTTQLQVCRLQGRPPEECRAIERRLEELRRGGSADGEGAGGAGAPQEDAEEAAEESAPPGQE
ncbi:hypothetical protein [Amphiplicatus metriothermophilus]|uniref:Uncharacterized protein n=1 Tax=Amphiplicatus metriothermophilus TaxID=1519374 RepID=A0A239PIC4_9PROT|nr:hypothetical protein [Amphiplicatus metriothermophilus]MBB5518138.1 tetratricopeptide (TPR) repeat protein [Amphiplicatus metriothermophilus]SNT67528.1 hypothetical protein SAMN06297382_0016 [Amphiplicatus metriothermophilus]